MKKLISLNNIIFFIAVGYLALTMFPAFLNNLGQEGKLLISDVYQVIEAAPTSKQLTFPGNKRTVAIFWATWCGPCKLEMNRLANSVKAGKIATGEIVAINPFEPAEIVRSFLKSHSYPFTFIEDKNISKTLEINRTPTTLFIENNKVLSLSSGISLVGIWKVESFVPAAL